MSAYSWGSNFVLSTANLHWLSGSPCCPACVFLNLVGMYTIRVHRTNVLICLCLDSFSCGVRTWWIYKQNPTRCNSVSSFYFKFIWSSTCFGWHTAHHQEPITALAAFGFAYVEGCWTCSCWTQSARPRTQHDYHHDTKVKPEAATAVIELLMVGGKTPEICWAVNKRQDNKLKNCCIWLVIYLNCTIMHGLTKLKPT